MYFRKYVHSFIVLITFAGLMTACSGPEDYLQRGISHYEAGRYDKARLEFKNALQIDKNNVNARYHLALTEEKLGNWREAYKQYKEIIKEEPQNTSARIALGNLYIGGRVPDLAREMADAVIAYDPNNSAAMLLRAKSYIVEQKPVLALEHAQAAYSADPKKSPETAVLLANLLAIQNQLDEAIVVLQESLKRNPGNNQLKLTLVSSYILHNENDAAKKLLDEISITKSDNAEQGIRKAESYVKLGMSDEAEQVLRSTEQLFPTSAVKIKLVEFLAKVRNFKLAEKELLKYIKQQPTEYPLRFALANLYEADGDMQEATRAYQDIIDMAGVNEYGLSARKKLAILFLKNGDESGAQKLIDEVLTQDSIDHDARILRATIYMNEKNLEAANTEINKILKHDPGRVPALRLAAKIAQEKKEPEKAEEYLKKAVSVEPKNMQLQLQLATLLDENEKPQQAIQQLLKAYELFPGNPLILEAVVKLQIKTQDWEGAFKTIDQFKSIHSYSPIGNYLAGLAYQARGDIKAARAEFDQALKISPNLNEPLTALVRSHLSKGEYKEAIARINGYLKENPDSAFAYQLLGEVQLSEKDYKATEASFRKAIQLNPKWTLPYLNLSDLFIDQNDQKNAVAILKTAMDASSNLIGAQLKLCTVYQHFGRNDLAIQEYENILKKAPDMDLAANNLAMLLIASHPVEKINQKRALELVSRFDDTENIVFKDTLAWVNYKAGNYEKAINILTDLVQKAPNVAEFHYHLGMSYYKFGYNKLAQHHLETAIKSKEAFPGIQEARKTLKDLQG